MKPFLIFLILLKTTASYCDAPSCTLSSRYADSVLKTDDGKIVSSQTNNDGVIVVKGYDCSQIKELRGDGTVVPVESAN